MTEEIRVWKSTLTSHLTSHLSVAISHVPHVDTDPAACRAVGSAMLRAVDVLAAIASIHGSEGAITQIDVEAARMLVPVQPSPEDREATRSAVEHLMGNLAIKRQAIPNAPHAGRE